MNDKTIGICYLITGLVACLFFGFIFGQSLAFKVGEEYALWNGTEIVSLGISFSGLIAGTFCLLGGGLLLFTKDSPITTQKVSKE